MTSQQYDRADDRADDINLVLLLATFVQTILGVLTTRFSLKRVSRVLSTRLLGTYLSDKRNSYVITRRCNSVIR